MAFALLGQRAKAFGSYASGFTIARPPGAVKGCLLVCVLGMHGSPPAFGASNFTKQRDFLLPSSNDRIGVFWGIDDGTSAFSIAYTGTKEGQGFLAAFSGNAESPFDTSSEKTTSGSKTITVEGVTTATAAELLVALALDESSGVTFTPAAGLTEICDDGTESTAGLHVAWGEQAKAEATGAKSFTGGASNVNSGGVLIAFKAVAPATLPLGAAAGSSSTALALHAPTRLPLGAAAGSSATALALSVPKKVELPLAPAAGVAATALALKVKPRLALSASGGSSTALALSVPSRVRVVVNQEFPPNRHAVIIRSPDGTVVGRWAQDEPSAENVFAHLTKSGEMQGGHKESGVVLSRDPKFAYSDLSLYNRFEVQSLGGEIVWSGSLMQEPQTSGDHLAIEPKAVGDWSLLEDDEAVIGPGFIDSDLTKWGEPSASRKLEAGAAKLNQNASVSLLPAGGVGAVPTPAAISHSWAQILTSAVAPDVAESVYDSGGIEIGRVLLDFLDITGTGTSTSSWINQLVALTTGLFGDGYEAFANLEGPEKLSQEYEVAAGRFILALMDFFLATFSGEGKWETQWRNMKVLGRYPLALQGVWPNVGFTAKQMLPIIAELAGLNTTDESLEDDGFVIPQAWFSSPATLLSKLTEITRYGLLDTFVFEDRLLQHRFPGTYGRRWQAHAGPSGLRNTGPDGTRVWTEDTVVWRDLDGSTKTAGAPGSGAMFEDPRLVIDDPRNPAVQAGRPRKRLLQIQDVCVESTAIKTAIRFLEELQLLDHSGEATLSGYVMTDTAVWLPVSYIQPGDHISFLGASDESYRKVTAPNYDDDSKTTRVSLDAPPEGQAALEERFGARLIELGAGAG